MQLALNGFFEVEVKIFMYAPQLIGERGILVGPVQEVPETPPPAESARVGEVEGIVGGVAVAVVSLQIRRALNRRVGGDEAPQERIVDAAVHVNELQLIEVFVTGEAAVGGDAEDGVIGVGGAVGEAPLAE